jgi:hypothetical protein
MPNIREPGTDRSIRSPPQAPRGLPQPGCSNINAKNVITATIRKTKPVLPKCI